MRTPCYIVAVHQYEREVLLYCTSKPHKVLHKGSGLRIRSRESRDRDTWASALKESHADSTFDQ